MVGCDAKTAKCSTFTCICAQNSSAYPAASVRHFGWRLTELLLNDGQLIGNAKLFGDGSRFGHPPSRSRHIISSGDNNVTRSQTRQCQTLRLSVQLQHGNVVSVCHFACPLVVDVSLDRVKRLKELDSAASQNRDFPTLTLSGSMSSSS